MRRFTLLFSLACFASSISLAQNVDDIFGAQNEPAKTHTSVESSVFKSIDESSAAVARKAEQIRIEREKKMRDAAASASTSQSGSSDSPSKDKNSSSSSSRQYSCVVFCDKQTGSVTVNVSAKDQYEARDIAEGQAEGLCRSGDYRRATSQKMEARQCQLR